MWLYVIKGYSRRKLQVQVRPFLSFSIAHLSADDRNIILNMTACLRIMPTAFTWHAHHCTKMSRIILVQIKSSGVPEDRRSQGHKLHHLKHHLELWKDLSKLQKVFQGPSKLLQMDFGLFLRGVCQENAGWALLLIISSMFRLESYKNKKAAAGCLGWHVLGYY